MAPITNRCPTNGRSRGSAQTSGRKPRCPTNAPSPDWARTSGPRRRCPTNGRSPGWATTSGPRQFQRRSRREAMYSTGRIRLLRRWPRRLRPNESCVHVHGSTSVPPEYLILKVHRIMPERANSLFFAKVTSSPPRRQQRTPRVRISRVVGGRWSCAGVTDATVTSSVSGQRRSSTPASVNRRIHARQGGSTRIPPHVRPPMRPRAPHSEG